jgi:hypothetical protein
VNEDGYDDIVTAPGKGGGPHVKVYSGKDGSQLMSFLAYVPEFTGGVYVAVGDLNADGFDDIVTGTGQGGAPRVKAFSGADGSVLHNFLAYDSKFAGGVRVAVGDMNGTFEADIVTAPGPGGGPHVKVFSGKDGSVLKSFLAYGAGFTGGVYVACADVNHDGFDDIVTAPGKGGGPHVKVYSGKDLSLLESFLAFEAGFAGGVRVAAGDVVRVFDVSGGSVELLQTLNPYIASFKGGVYVAVADLNQDGKADIVTGAGEGGAPRIKAFHGQSGALLANFLAGGAADTFGARVSSADSNGDGDDEIVVGYGPGGSPKVKSYGKAGGVVETLSTFDAAFKGGVYVG